MKLVNHKGNFYLINDLMTRMAKDLPAGTLVFCIDEFFSGHPEMRLSSGNDNCFGCQPVVACTHSIPNFKVSPEVLAKYELLPDLEVPHCLTTESVYSIDHIKMAYSAGEMGHKGTLDNFMLFMEAYMNIWGCKAEITDDNKCYMVSDIKQLIIENGILKAV